jgi:hypothetical protein
MRFELNADNVITLSDMIYDVADRLKDTHTNSSTAYLSRLRKMAIKLKIYGISAFENRELYRKHIKSIFDFLDEVQLVLKSDGK